MLHTETQPEEAINTPKSLMCFPIKKACVSLPIILSHFRSFHLSLSLAWFYYGCARNRLFDGQWHPFSASEVYTESANNNNETQRRTKMLNLGSLTYIHHCGEWCDAGLGTSGRWFGRVEKLPLWFWDLLGALRDWFQAASEQYVAGKLNWACWSACSRDKSWNFHPRTSNRQRNRMSFRFSITQRCVNR